jgi:GT2 family glycosyltransferase
MECVSVIIVNYNGAHHLKECLASLKSLDYPGDNLEVIVFDNGSTDDSIRVIKKAFSTAKIIQHEKNIGFAAPHRIAAARALGDVLAFLNNDMKVDKRWIKEGVSLLNPSQGVVCSASKILSWNGKHTDFYGGSLQYLGYADQLKDVVLRRGEDILFPCGGAMFIKKDAFVDSGCFDDDYFAIFEDVDLGWRLWVMGYRVVMAPDSVVYHKGHGTLDSRKEEKKRYLMHRNALMTIIKNYDEENLKKVLPLAFVLAVKRALLFMEIDKRNFHFWEDEESGTIQPRNYLEGCLHLAVMDDIFGSTESLMKKRKTVQDSRKRGDREIFPLFRDPFRNLMGYKDYLWD